MGTKSTKMRQALKARMTTIRNDYPQCEQLMDYLKDQITEYADAPLASDKRRTQYEHIKGVCDKLLPVADNLIDLTSKSGLLLDTFDQFLQKKRSEHQDDWTSVKKKSLVKNEQFVQDTRPQLERIQRICDQIPKFVKDTLEKCKQG